MCIVYLSYSLRKSNMPYVTNYDVHLFLLPRILQRVWGGTLSKNKMCQLELAADFGYITMEDLNTLEVQYEEIAKMLSGLRKSKLKV